MRRIFFEYNTGYVGQGGCDCLEIEDHVTDANLDDMAFCQAIDYASSYGVEICSEECEDDYCEMEHPGCTSIEGCWSVYDPKLHDQLRPGGGSWFED